MDKKPERPKVTVCEIHSNGVQIAGRIDYPDGTSRHVDATVQYCTTNPDTWEVDMIYEFNGLPSHLQDTRHLVLSEETRRQFRDTAKLQGDLAEAALQSPTVHQYVLECGLGVKPPFNTDRIVCHSDEK